MIKYIANTPPSVHLLLLVLIPLLRWPGFLAGYYHGDEALSLLLAERALTEGPLYIGAWYAGPPLHIWFYESFVSLFGTYALLGLRIFAVLWIYCMAIYLNGIWDRFKVLRRYEGLPGILFAILASVPWTSLHMSSELLAMWPVLVAYNRLLNLTENASRNYGLMFQAGALMMVAMLTDYKVVFLFLGMIVAYLLLRTARVDELVAALGGVAVVGLTFVGFLYLQGTLSAFNEIGFRYYFQRLEVSGSELYPFTSLDTLLSISLSWGFVIVIAFVGFAHFRLRFFTYVVKIRSMELVMAAWLVSVFLMLLAKWRRLDVSDFHLLLPPIAFYAAKALDFRWPRRIRVVILTAVLAGMCISYLSGWSLRYPQTFRWLPIAERPVWLYGAPNRGIPFPASLDQKVNRAQAKQSIWIMAHQPHWYLALDATCPNPYVDFRIAYHKFPILPGHQQGITGPEEEKDIFHAFTQQPPAYIIDPNGLFASLQQRYPSLFAMYQPLESKGIVVYSRQ